jgi:hypothetical protein
MFRKKQVIDFLYKVIKDEELEIYPFIKYESLHINTICQNKISISKLEPNLRLCQIGLNRKYFCVVKDSTFLKASLLHEIGHAVFFINSKVDNEFYAHMWAIEKAEKMGMPKVVNQLIIMILEWGEIDWNDLQGRRYLLAYKKFKDLIKEEIQL